MAAVELQIALDTTIADMLKQRAAELQKPANLYLSELIVDDVRRHEDELAAEGYRLLSCDTEEFAAAALPLANEVWPKWEDAQIDDEHQAKAG